jgi:DNA-directed RNA polymerase subunit A'
MRIMQTLGKARDDTGGMADKSLGLENSAVIMARSGARGSILNLTQMAACVGQQAVRGERIRRGYADRTLPHFDKGDLGADAHGFVKASYKSGLNPTEYFFHAIGGREGLVDTAVRTSQSGYLQRRLVNALQDLEVQYDGSVRETRGVIVQFKYGEDGIDSTKSDYSKPEAIHRVVRSVTGKEVV